MLHFVQQFPIRGGGVKEMLYLVQDFNYRRPYSSTKTALTIQFTTVAHQHHSQHSIGTAAALHQHYISTTEAPQMLYRSTTDASQ